MEFWDAVSRGMDRLANKLDALSIKHVKKSVVSLKLIMIGM